MIYEQTHFNILALLMNVGVLDRVQILRFFSDAMPEAKIEQLLNRLTVSSYLRYDSASDRYRYHSAPKVTDAVLAKRIRAFWVLANWGSRSVTEIYTLTYPLQYMIYTPENIAYDVTVCNSVSEAQLASAVWQRNCSRSVPDSTNHIGIVPHAGAGEELRPYGFDSYCIIDPVTYATNYYPLE